MKMGNWKELQCQEGADAINLDPVLEVAYPTDVADDSSDQPLLSVLL